MVVAMTGIECFLLFACFCCVAMLVAITVSLFAILNILSEILKLQRHTSRTTLSGIPSYDYGTGRKMYHRGGRGIWADDDIDRFQPSCVTKRETLTRADGSQMVVLVSEPRQDALKSAVPSTQ